MMSNAFDPLEFGFKRVDMNPPGYTVYEKDLGDLTKENPDFLRLNIFLSQDGDFVTVLAGLFDAAFADGRLEFENSHLISFHEQYHETRFRGYIRDNKTAARVLETLKLDNYYPSKLEIDGEGRLCCNPITP